MTSLGELLFGFKVALDAASHGIRSPEAEQDFKHALELAMAAQSQGLTGADNLGNQLPVGEDGWPKLDKPAKVIGTFGAGVSTRLVVEAAQRAYAYGEETKVLTPVEAREKERKRRQAWDMLNGPLDASAQQSERVRA